MPRRLLIHGIDQIERVPGIAALIRLGLNPDRKELRAQIPPPCFVQADVANVLRIRRADVKALVEKSLRRVGMRVDDDGGVE